MLTQDKRRSTADTSNGTQGVPTHSLAHLVCRRCSSASRRFVSCDEIAIAGSMRCTVLRSRPILEPPALGTLLASMSASRALRRLLATGFDTAVSCTCAVGCADTAATGRAASELTAATLRRDGLQ
jgi:hypothetical protein